MLEADLRIPQPSLYLRVVVVLQSAVVVLTVGLFQRSLKAVQWRIFCLETGNGGFVLALV
jgi:hypothetical protein